MHFLKVIKDNLASLCSFIMAGTLLLSPGLPKGYEKAKWGMSPEELQTVISVQKMDRYHTYGFAEHDEENPEVYVGINDKHERVEYYFFEGKLYKIFIIYDTAMYHPSFYEDLVEDLISRFGPYTRKFEENHMGMVIKHTFWEDEISSLDLRMGGGFIYQVRIDKNAAKRKRRLKQLKNAI